MEDSNISILQPLAGCIGRRSSDCKPCSCIEARSFTRALRSEPQGEVHGALHGALPAKALHEAPQKLY